MAVNNAFDVLTNSEKAEYHNFYSVMATPKGFGVRREMYERGASGCSWQMINIEKREMTGYFKRKGLPIATQVEAVGESTCSLLYILSAADRSKVDVFKINHSSLQDVPDSTVIQAPEPKV